MAWVRCAGCGATQQAAIFRGQPVSSCGTCRRRLEVRVLPAVFGVASRPPALPSNEGEIQLGETRCFYDPVRVATKSCSHCGVFVSDAWVATWGEEVVCLKCLDELRTKGADTKFQAKRVLWDNVVLGLSVGPWLLSLIFVFTVLFYAFAVFSIMLTLVAAPAALFLGLRYWNAPRGLVPRGRGRLMMGVGLAVLQLLAWVVGVVALVHFWTEL
ncbi:hypothetical protein FEM03_15450 [Phragmitibacter flavus]|uniref:Uncharacterized protein n=1 Tax=Phragmitibacter flavus TaxID=2576071 RepID=A0A5R8KBN9_9BACT|nr:hypothetical protein [Phragmitibacter flavus]TLD69722.1 hypothetical protein FEM03_15450 [Phragmitibacter flavus]